MGTRQRVPFAYPPRCTDTLCSQNAVRSCLLSGVFQSQVQSENLLIYTINYTRYCLQQWVIVFSLWTAVYCLGKIWKSAMKMCRSSNYSSVVLMKSSFPGYHSIRSEASHVSKHGLQITALERIDSILTLVGQRLKFHSKHMPLLIH